MSDRYLISSPALPCQTSALGRKRALARQGLADILAELPDSGTNRELPLSPIMTDVHNPKLDDTPASNTEKDPDEWVSGGDPMTGAQASYLKTLSEEAHKPELFDDKIDKAEASRRIDALKSGLELP